MNSWSSFQRRIRVDKPIKEVYQCWSQREIIEKWFLQKAEFISEGTILPPNHSIRQGNHFNWKWNNWDIIETGHVLEANGHDLISFTFGTGGKVSIRLFDVKDSTEILLTQYDIPSDEESKLNYYVECICGWTFWLTNLKAFLEHGITLHAKGLTQEETLNLVNS